MLDSDLVVQDGSSPWSISPSAFQAHCNIAGNTQVHVFLAFGDLAG